jgi:hypothetical protein
MQWLWRGRYKEENLKGHVGGAGSPTSPPLLIDAPGLFLSNNGGIFLKQYKALIP